MIESIRNLGRAGVDSVASMGRAGNLFVQSITWGGPGSAGFLDFIRQIHSVGVRSLSIIVVAGFFVGMVLALQGYNILIKFGSVSALGTMVSLLA